MDHLDSNTDDVDALGFFRKSRTFSQGDAVILGSAEDPDYSMAYPKKGKCLIFNNKTFDSCTGLDTRHGTDFDATRLYCRFRDLDFDVKLYKDFSVEKIEKKLKKVAGEDHSQNSAFICCILSHGEQNILFGRDGKYATESVFAPFRGDVCPKLAGKPKMFFIQACQGDRLDESLEVKCQSQKIFTDSPSSQEAMEIPTYADFLIAYCTVPGFLSWRDTLNGSWFIQALCAVLEKHAHDMDILSILTIVNRRVALDFKSYTPQNPKMHLKKQMPLVTSTLLRNVRLRP